MVLKVFGSVDKLSVIRIIFICPMLLSWTDFDMSLLFIYWEKGEQWERGRGKWRWKERKRGEGKENWEGGRGERKYREREREGKVTINHLYYLQTLGFTQSLNFLVLFRSTFYALTLFDLPNFICILPMYLHPFISTPSFYPFTPPSSLHLSTFSLTFLVRLYKPPSSI